MSKSPKDRPRRGRGASNNPKPRYLDISHDVNESDDEWGDGWTEFDDQSPKLKTTVTEEHPKSIINRNKSPDIPFEQSINPYRGCEHGCIYCYARPAHAYVDLSPGLDFESKLFCKPNAAELLRNELSRPKYRCSAISLGANTDAFQPTERRMEISRSIIEVLRECNHPFTIVTKSSLVERDIDLIAPMAEKDLVQVFVSVTSLDRELARKMEPRAAAPQRRIETIRRLSEASIPVGVMVAPIIPGLNDSEIEEIIAQAAAAGAASAAYVMLRLPLEVRDLFVDWLETHYPLKKSRVMSLIKDVRGGRDNDPQFGSRLRGRGEVAGLIRQRFERSVRQHGLNRSRHELRTDLFKKPARSTSQMELF